MSWKGFQKAVSRLPHLVLQKTGAVEETKDAEFNELSIRFECTSRDTERILEDVNKFREAILGLLTHQISMLETFQSVLATTDGEGPTTGTRQQMQLTEQILLALQKQHAEVVLKVDQQIQDRAQRILTELIRAQQSIATKITKRAHKLLDYDRHRHSLRKLETGGEYGSGRSISDEHKMIKLEQAKVEAEQEYHRYNDQLKEDLPIFFKLHSRLLLPVLEALSMAEGHLCQAQKHIFDRMRTWDDCPYGEIVRKHEEHLTMAISLLNQIPLLRPPNSNLGRPLGSSIPPSLDSEDEQKRSPKDVPTHRIDPHSQLSSGKSSPDRIFTTKGKQTPSSDQTNLTHQSAAKLAAKFETISVRSPPPLPPKRHYVIAQYEFEGQEAGDLSFKPGDRIQLVRRTEHVEDWWTGRLANGRTGIFPGNYVREE